MTVFLMLWSILSDTDDISQVLYVTFVYSDNRLYFSLSTVYLCVSYSNNSSTCTCTIPNMGICKPPAFLVVLLSLPNPGKFIRRSSLKESWSEVSTFNYLLFRINEPNLRVKKPSRTYQHEHCERQQTRLEVAVNELGVVDESFIYLTVLRLTHKLALVGFRGVVYISTL